MHVPVKPAPGPIKFIRVPMSDVEAAKSVVPPRLATSERSRKFAVMGAAILEKLCRSGKLDVRAKRTSPYILNTMRGRAAVSVVVSAVDGDLATKHMIVPLSALQRPPEAVRHVFVCAFVSKLERVREKHGGLNARLAGWATELEVLKHMEAHPRIDSQIEVAAVPVSDLRPIQTLRHYLAPENKGEGTCENPVSAACSSTSEPPPSLKRSAETATPSTISSSSGTLTRPAPSPGV